MHIDLRTVTIKPLRQTYSHIARRFGADKPASRYQEGTFDLQASANFHYRPTWSPQYLLFDASRSAIKMADWYALRDPRQFYYGTYTIARGKQQEATESAFDFVESRGLDAALPEQLRELAQALLLPLRHVAWGASMNNTSIGAYGYGTAFTQPCVYQAFDQLGIAQYLTRIGLLFGDTDSLDQAKRAWLEDGHWQDLRRYLEDTFVLSDPFELHVAQNAVLDGLLYPLVYGVIIGEAFTPRGGTAVAMLTKFMTDWFAESERWVDATLKAVAAESADNKAQLGQWITVWRDRADNALLPVARLALGERGAEQLATVIRQFNSRMAKAGVDA